MAQDILIENKNLSKQLEALGRTYVQELTNQLKIEGKEASGSLIKSLQYRVDQNYKTPILSILANDYLTYVDQGRRPGAKMPPSNQLLDWVKERGIKIKGQTDGQTAFVIARSIGIKGIKPTNVIDKTTQIVMDKELKNVAEASRQDVIDMIKNILI